jgi:hypothetical protein
VIDDVIGIIVLSFVVAFARASAGGADLGAVILVVVRMAAYFAVAIAAGRLLSPILQWAGRLPVTQAVLAASVVIVLIYAWAAEYGGGVAAITGAYVAGVLLAQTPFKRQIDASVHPLTYSNLRPDFLHRHRPAGERARTRRQRAVYVRPDPGGDRRQAGRRGRLCAPLGIHTRESIRVGAGMISRGEVGLDCRRL